MRLLQVPLVISAVVIGWWLVTRPGARTQALRRLGLVALAAFAVVTTLLPGIWTTMAGWVGVGRGTDLLLYVLVVAFAAYAATSQRRIRALEARLTKVARRLAIDEAEQPDAPGRAGATPWSSAASPPEEHSPAPVGPPTPTDRQRAVSPPTGTDGGSTR